MGTKTQITLHHCIQGWSGIAAWGGLPLPELIRPVRPKPEAHAVVFYSFGEGGEGGEFYDSLPLETAMHGQTLLAYEMNYQPLPELRGARYGSGRENQLGFTGVRSSGSERSSLSRTSKVLVKARAVTTRTAVVRRAGEHLSRWSRASCGWV